MSQAHTHPLANFGTLYANVEFSDYDNCKGCVNVYKTDFSRGYEFCQFFENPTQRDDAIAGAFEELTKLAKAAAAKQREWALKHGVPV